MTELSNAAIQHLRIVADLPDLSQTKYEILDALGRGGMGTVYLARDRELDRLVALKVVGTPGTPALGVERLVEEAKILAQLEHPGIVPVHDVGRTPDGRTFYTMKLVRGRRLDETLSADTTVAQHLQIFERICEAVAFAHARGVIHRDLKPENVMVGPFGEILVLDWGVAKRRGVAEVVLPTNERAQLSPVPRTGPGTVLGTPGYMAPEQARGESSVTDERSDVYSLGAILGFLMSRREGGESPSQSNEPHRVPRPLQAIVHKATQTDPAKRYQQVLAIAADIGRFRASLPVEAYRETFGERARRLVLKYRVPLALVLAYLFMRVLLQVFVRG